MKLLVIEDDNRIANLVERALTEDWHSITLSHDGREGADFEFIHLRKKVVQQLSVKLASLRP